MASTTKGSIKISTANGIGAALVDVLGGEGYKPDEWEQNINLCGIHAADIESALENIEEDAGTGAERGSILLSTANAIGATLNKKFNTSRGFKPKEWASAASKLEPLPERTASGAIANITDGADGVPVKNWLVTLPASLDGYSEVNAKQAKKNLIKPDKYQTAGNNLALGQNDGTSFGTFLKAGTYTISYETTGETCYIYRREENDASNTNMGKKLSTSFTIESDGNFRFWLYGDGAVSANISNVQIEIGSTATAYEAYEAPTTYTANLGRTVYGADVDLVSGQGTETHGYIDLGSFNWVKVTSGQTPYFSTTTALSPSYKWASQNNNVLCNNYSYASIGSTGSAEGFFVTDGSFVRIRDANYESMTAEQFKTAITGTVLVYETATGTSFTFDGQGIPSLLGVNNFWADEGDSAVTYRKDLDIPDPEPEPGNLLGMNNENNEENEEESEGL